MKGHISDKLRKILQDPEAREQLGDALANHTPIEIKVGSSVYHVSFSSETVHSVSEHSGITEEKIETHQEKMHENITKIETRFIQKIPGTDQEFDIAILKGVMLDHMTKGQTFMIYNDWQVSKNYTVIEVMEPVFKMDLGVVNPTIKEATLRIVVEEKK